MDIPCGSCNPPDERVLARAVAAGASYRVTEDEDLLVLGTHAGVQIVRAAAFLRIIETALADGPRPGEAS